MMTDADGCPINPRTVIAGRAFENQGDIALSDSDANRIVKQLAGRDIQYNFSEYNIRYLSFYN